MKKQYINIGGKDYAPILVGFGECCLNCDIEMKECWCQCHEMEDTEEENVALKLVKHHEPPTFFQRLREKLKIIFAPIESDLPF